MKETLNVGSPSYQKCKKKIIELWLFSSELNELKILNEKSNERKLLQQ